MDTTYGVTLAAWSVDGQAAIGSFHVDHFEKRGLTLYIVGWFMPGPDEVMVSQNGTASNKGTTVATTASSGTSKRYTYRRIADPGVKIGMPVAFSGASCDSVMAVVGPLDYGSIHDKAVLRVKDPKKDPKLSQTMFTLMLAPGLLKGTDPRGSLCHAATLINSDANRSSVADDLNKAVNAPPHPTSTPYK
jgi:hypothetical protein